jgi:dTDP-4-dehydrorhamnose reductase
MAAERTILQAVFLVTGGTGQVGQELIRELAPLGKVMAPTRAELDLARPASITEFIRRVRPTMIVNAAAYTAVDRAESDRDACFTVNATAPGILAEEARRTGAALIHYSTDYVFDGTKREPYLETDEPRPLNAYGESKLAGERAIAEVGGRWIVLRTSWVYGTHGHNFLLTILRLARERDELRVVNDQIGAPTWSNAIAQGTKQLISVAASESRGGPAKAMGVYHMSAGGATNWFDFAQAILAADPRREEQRYRRLVGIRTAEYATPAARPRWSVLNNDRLARDLGIRLSDWSDDLKRAMRNR